MRHTLTLCLWLLAPAALAQSAGADLRPGETALSDAAMATEVRGATHEFFDGGKSFFSLTDAYSYTYPDGGIAYGRYEILEDGLVCTYFNHGFDRCDTYVMSNGRLVLITETGLRFPVRTATRGGV